MEEIQVQQQTIEKEHYIFITTLLYHFVPPKQH
jgi:hypothetical protein